MNPELASGLDAGELSELVGVVSAIVRDLDGTIRFWNRAAERTYGWTEHEALGRISHQLLSTRFPEPLDDITAKLYAGGRWTGQLTHRTRDGREICVMSHWTLYRDSAGAPKSILEVNHDITELKRVEDALRASNQDLKHFAYAIAHDVQAPVRTISGLAELLRRRKCQGADADECLDLIIEAAARMQRMLTDLLAYTRLLGDEDVHFQAMDFSKAVRIARRDLSASIAESSAIITHDKLPVLMAAPAQIERLMENLIGNAIKYKRDARPEIHISAEEREDEWLFCVSDNCAGFDPEHAERIFGVFQRLHGSEQPGSGVGLAICRKIVERHGGRIWAESEPGVGSRFWFTISKHLG